jgi:hypothetical protein
MDLARPAPNVECFEAIREETSDPLPCHFGLRRNFLLHTLTAEEKLLMTLISRGCNRLRGAVKNWINGSQFNNRAPRGAALLATGNSSAGNLTERIRPLMVSRGISE